MDGPFGNFPGTTDFSFKVTANFKKDKLTVFGLGGFSDNDFDVHTMDTNELGSQFPHDITISKTYLLGGVSYRKFLPQKGYIHTAIGSNYNREYHYLYDSIGAIDVIDSRNT